MQSVLYCYYCVVTFPSARPISNLFLNHIKRQFYKATKLITRKILFLYEISHNISLHYNTPSHTHTTPSHSHQANSKEMPIKVLFALKTITIFTYQSFYIKILLSGQISNCFKESNHFTLSTKFTKFNGHYCFGVIAPSIVCSSFYCMPIFCLSILQGLYYFFRIAK